LAFQCDLHAGKIYSKMVKNCKIGQASFTSVKTILPCSTCASLWVRSCICPEKHSLNRAMYPMRNNTKK
jgi:hypothetical protein